jgi:hypothetical protein
MMMMIKEASAGRPGPMLGSRANGGGGDDDDDDDDD